MPVARTGDFGGYGGREMMYGGFRSVRNSDLILRWEIDGGFPTEWVDWFYGDRSGVLSK